MTLSSHSGNSSSNGSSGLGDGIFSTTGAAVVAAVASSSPSVPDSSAAVAGLSVSDSAGVFGRIIYWLDGRTPAGSIRAPQEGQ